MPDVKELIAHGVDVALPHSVRIDDDIQMARISNSGVKIHPGCRLAGARTFIGAKACIGTEGPATIVNCQIGPDVELKSGYFEDAVFLEGAVLGSGSHVRGGTILEEQASTAHCVGLKQTILLPFVTLGSLINFCDCLMAGGTSRNDHSEVGSSFVHFNFTPNQDKATASLVGDIPRGVMLNQHPIFLGGQGGLVGPCRLEYGTVSAAGTIIRKDQLKPDHLVFGGAGKGGSIPWKPGVYRSDTRIIHNNLIYLGNLVALRAWYQHIRKLFVSTRFPEPLLEGLIEKVDLGIMERCNRLRSYIERIGRNVQMERWRVFEDSFTTERDSASAALQNDFVNNVRALDKAETYLETIKRLSSQSAQKGTAWLQSIVTSVVERGQHLLDE